MTTYTLQPGQPGEGLGYAPQKPLPYPIHVGDDDRCANVPGYHDAARDALPILAGFQPDVETQQVTLWPDDFRADPSAAVGLVPVFLEPGGIADGMFSLGTPVTAVCVDGRLVAEARA